MMGRKMERFTEFVVGNIERMATSCLGISASGWLTFMIGFASQQLSLNPIIHALQFLFVPWYLAAMVGPIMYVLVGLYMMLGKYFKFAKIFKSASIVFIVVYIGALAAPMFFVATLFSSAAAGIQDAVNALDVVVDIPDLSDSVDLGPFDFVGDIPGSIVDILIGIITAMLYIILIIMFDIFISGIRSQFIGGLTSVVFLGFTLMLWPFIKRETSEHKKIC